MFEGLIIIMHQFLLFLFLSLSIATLSQCEIVPNNRFLLSPPTLQSRGGLIREEILVMRGGASLFSKAKKAVKSVLSRVFSLFSGKKSYNPTKATGKEKKKAKDSKEKVPTVQASGRLLRVGSSLILLFALNL